MAFRKGKKKPNCSITFSYRRKRKLFWGENWKNKPYLRRRLLDHFDNGLNHFSNCDLISASSPGMSRFLLFFIPSLLIRSLSFIFFISSENCAFYSSVALSSSSFLHPISLQSLLLFISLQSLPLFISPSLPIPFFPFPISFHLSTRKLPLLLLFAS